MNTRSNRTKLTGTRRNLQQYTREMKWEAKAEELQQVAEKKDMTAFYNGLRELYGPKKRGTTQLTDLDGETIIQEKAEILHRFTNYFDKLLNIAGEVQHSSLATIKLRRNIVFFDKKPEFKEALDAISATNKGKAPGMCGIPAEI